MDEKTAEKLDVKDVVENFTQDSEKAENEANSATDGENNEDTINDEDKEGGEDDDENEKAV